MTTTHTPSLSADAIRLAGRARAIPPSATAALDARAKSLIAAGLDVINLTSGEPAFPTVDPAANAGIAAIEEDFTRYTAAAGLAELRSAVAERLSAAGAPYGSDEVVITAGAKPALHYAFTTLLEPGDEVLLPAPYWVSYPHMITLAGGVPVIVEPDAGSALRITPERLRAAITPRTRVLLLNNPSNPSGIVYRRDELLALAEVAVEHHLTIISDEICDHWVYNEEGFTPLASLGASIADRTVTIGGVSKTFAMTGWRIGWLAAPPHVAAAVAALQSHTASAPSSISQRAALGALQTDLADELELRRRALDERRLTTIKALNEIPGLAVAGDPTGAFFLLADVRGTYGKRLGDRVISSAADFAELLLQHAKVAVVPGADFAAPHHARVSYTVPPERLAEALGRIADFTRGLAGDD